MSLAVLSVKVWVRVCVAAAASWCGPCTRGSPDVWSACDSQQAALWLCVAVVISMWGMGHLALSQREPSGLAPLCVCVYKLYRSSECMKALLDSSAVSLCQLCWCGCPLMGLQGAKERERRQGKSVLALQHHISAIGCVEAVTHFPDGWLNLPVLLWPLCLTIWPY